MPPTLRKLAFLMQNCPPAPLVWMGRWKGGNAGSKRVPAVLHPHQYELSTSKAARPWGAVMKLLPPWGLQVPEGKALALAFVPSQGFLVWGIHALRLLPLSSSPMFGWDKIHP